MKKNEADGFYSAQKERNKRECFFYATECKSSNRVHMASIVKHVGSTNRVRKIWGHPNVKDLFIELGETRHILFQMC